MLREFLVVLVLPADAQEWLNSFCSMNWLFGSVPIGRVFVGLPLPAMAVEGLFYLPKEQDVYPTGSY